MAHKVLRIVPDWGLLAELEPRPLGKWIVRGSIVRILPNGGSTHAGDCEGSKKRSEDERVMHYW